MVEIRNYSHEEIRIIEDFIFKAQNPDDGFDFQQMYRSIFPRVPFSKMKRHYHLIANDAMVIEGYDPSAVKMKFSPRGLKTVELKSFTKALEFESVSIVQQTAMNNINVAPQIFIKNYYGFFSFLKLNNRITIQQNTPAEKPNNAIAAIVKTLKTYWWAFVVPFLSALLLLYIEYNCF